MVLMFSGEEYIKRFNLPSALMAHDEVLLQKNAFQQLERILEQKHVWDNLGVDIGYEKLVITPDFHKGSPMPIGVTLQTKNALFPEMIGGDIGCGMQMIVLEGITKEEIENNIEKVKSELRNCFFQGGRNIAMNRKLQFAMFRYGLVGLYETELPVQGLLSKIDKTYIETFYAHSYDNGSLEANSIFQGIEDYIDKLDEDIHYDAQLGTIGGGNHFVEIGSINEVMDKQFAWHWNVKQDAVTVLLHSGSLNFGKMIDAYFADLTRDIYNIKDKKILSAISRDNPYSDLCLDAMNNAANFAICNRMIMSFMVVNSLEKVFSKKIDICPVWDSPHNLI